MEKPRSIAALFVAAAMILIMLYVGSYYALVVPRGYIYTQPTWHNGVEYGYETWQTYRIVGRWPHWLYWPIRRLDQRLRPKVWGEPERWLDPVGPKPALQLLVIRQATLRNIGCYGDFSYA